MGVGVTAAVPVPLLLGVPVEVLEGVGGGVALDSDTLAVLEGLAPRVSEEVGEDERVELALSVLLGVAVGVVVAEGLAEPVAVGEGVEGAVALPL